MTARRSRTVSLCAVTPATYTINCPGNNMNLLGRTDAASRHSAGLIVTVYSPVEAKIDPALGSRVPRIVGNPVPKGLVQTFIFIGRFLD